MNQSNDAYDRIALEWRQFSSIWHEVRAVWKDDVASQFERRFVSALESDIPKFLAALETLKDELKVAQRELR